MADNKWSEWKKEHLEGKTKICQPRRMDIEVERTFQKPLGNSPKVSDKPKTKIINSQLNIKERQFTEEELNVVLSKIKSRKAAGLNKILPKL